MVMSNHFAMLVYQRVTFVLVGVGVAKACRCARNMKQPVVRAVSPKSAALELPFPDDL